MSDTELEPTTQDLDTAAPDTGAAPSLREALETSFEKASEDTSGVDAAQPPAPPKGEKPRDEVGRFAKAEKTEKAPAAKVVVPTSALPKGQAGAQGAKPPAGATQEGAPPPPKAPAEPLKAPASWKPEARETWAQLPPAAQAEVHRRETEVQRLLQATANDRKLSADLRDVISPYLGMIQAENSHPLQTIGRLLQTGAALRTAPPAQRAQLVGEIAHTYGVDLGQVVVSAVRSGRISVEALDSALAAGLDGKAPPQGPAFDPQAFEQKLTSKILGELNQRGEAAAAEHSAAEVESFLADKEFAADVRGAMADYIETRAARRLPTTLQQAYDFAVRADEGISKVLQQREAAKSAATASAATQRTKAAASSVKSRPAPGSGGKEPTTLRESLEAAWSSRSA